MSRRSPARRTRTARRRTARPTPTVCEQSGVGSKAWTVPSSAPPPTAVAPTLPTTVSLANGGGQGSAYVNLANRASVSVAVALPASALASDTVTVVVSQGVGSVTATVQAEQVQATSPSPGSTRRRSATARSRSPRLRRTQAGNSSAARTATVTKDTVAPGVPTGTYTEQQRDRRIDRGRAEADATVSATQTLPSAAGPYSIAAARAVPTRSTSFATNGKPPTPIAVRYLITATDLAGNTGRSSDAELQRHEVEKFTRIG